MAKVNREQMESTLDALQEVGVVRAWERRPLGIYHLHLPGGERLTPDTKEAAMWVMGAAVVLAGISDRRHRHPPGFDAQFIGGALDEFVRLGHLTAWEVDADGDYTLRSDADTDYPLYFGPDEIVLFVGGMASAIRSAERLDSAPPPPARPGDGPTVFAVGEHELMLIGEELTLANDEGDDLPPRSAWPVIIDESTDIVIAIAHEEGLVLAGQGVDQRYGWSTIQEVDWASDSIAVVTLKNGTTIALRLVMQQYTPDFCDTIDYVMDLDRNKLL